MAETHRPTVPAPVDENDDFQDHAPPTPKGMALQIGTILIAALALGLAVEAVLHFARV